VRCAFAAVLVVERLVVQVAAAQRVDDLVLQHRRQPRAQRRSAAEAGAAREDGFDHVVDRVLGERRVAQLAQGEADEVRAVRDELGDRDRHRLGVLPRRRCRQRTPRRHGVGARGRREERGVHAGGPIRQKRCATVAAGNRAHLAKDHASITSL